MNKVNQEERPNLLCAASIYSTFQTSMGPVNSSLILKINTSGAELALRPVAHTRSLGRSSWPGTGIVSTVVTLVVTVWTRSRRLTGGVMADWLCGCAWLAGCCFFNLHQ